MNTQYGKFRQLDHITGQLTDLTPALSAGITKLNAGPDGVLVLLDPVINGAFRKETRYITESVERADQYFTVFFEVLDENTILLLGSISAVADGTELYVDCAVGSAWIYPVLDGSVLTIRQAYTINQNQTILEVR